MSIKIELDLSDVMSDYLADCRGSEYGVEEGVSIEKVILGAIIQEVKYSYKETIKEVIKEIVDSEVKTRHYNFARTILGGVLDEIIDEDEIRKETKRRINNFVGREVITLTKESIDEAIAPHLKRIEEKVESEVKRSVGKALRSIS